SDFNTLILTALKMVRLSLEHGHCEFAACGYVAHALILSVSGDTPNAYAFGTLAMRLNQKFANPFVIPKVNNTFANFVNHYSNHIADNVPIYQESYQSCLLSGDRWWGAWAAGWIRSAQFIKGDPLDKVLETCDLFHQYIQDSGYQPLYQMLLLDRHVALALQGKTLGKLSLSAGPFSEEGLVKSLTEMGFEFGLYWYWLMKALLHYLHERHAQALACVREASKRKDFIAFLMTYPDFFLYESLILAANHDRVEPAEQAAFRGTISANVERMRGWAVHCKGNFEHRHLLMSAELARLEGEHARAEDLYEQAIDAAHDSRYVHHEALANELAAKHGLLRRRPKAAKGYLIEARYLYSRWGAAAKVAQLTATYPQLLAVQSTPGTISATEWTDRERNPGSTKVESQTLELATVMKAAQALSQEIVLGKLLERMMRIGMENAGAQRGVLLVERDGNLLVEASAAVDGHITVQQSIPVDQAQDLPLSIIKYVQRTGETLTLDDAASDPRFQADPYLARHRIKSVLCLPSMRQAGRLGIFYLENNLVKGAFPPERTRVLQVLSTQAAISLENAVLYATMEQRVRERTAQLARSNEEVSQTLQRLKDTQKQLVLQEKLASLGTLTAGIAHEIKNPLNFVNNFAELSVGLSEELRKELEAHRDKLGADTVGYLDEILSDLRQNVEKINEHGKRADRIVRGMLDHARLSAGDKRPVDVNALLTEYVNLAYQGLRSQNQSINVAIETSYDESLRPVELAPQEFGRVVLNLVNNACHAVLARKDGAGGSFSPTIHVSTREQGGLAEIRIRDNGGGIPQAVREKIFTPFFTTKPPGEGTGLGLSISHQIIEGLGGTLRFESEEGKFTEFIITLPQQKQESRTG
ncbi:MAG TPA: ATP-binding protein, partial [Myxococcaceae bacterium]|nr:ATP-binding protein [Myxococcaceae bacterium]